jgi:hypothetical protein
VDGVESAVEGHRLLVTDVDFTAADLFRDIGQTRKVLGIHGMRTECEATRRHQQ